VLPDTPPSTLTDAQIRELIAQGATAAAAADAGASADGGASWPVADGQTVFALFAPSGVTVTLPGNGGSTWVGCVDFGAYHGPLPLFADLTTTYAVIGRCDGYLGASGIDAVTSAASHELVESATDPLITAYEQADFAGSGWATTAGGGEVGDLCKLDADSDARPADMAGFAVQRTWSNAAAAAGRDPCVPAPAGAPYFLGVPELAPTETYPGEYALGIAVRPGESTTVDVHLVGAGVAGLWSLQASEPSVPQLPDPAHQLTLVLDRSQGASGDVVHLLVARAAAAPDAGLVPPAPFVITATQGGVQHSYWGVVGDPAF